MLKLFKIAGVKILALSLAITFMPASAVPSATSFIGVSQAQADPYWRGHRYRHYRHHHRRGISPGGAAILGGIVGLGIGAAIASQPRYYEPAPRYYRHAPRPVYRAAPVAYAPAPWTGEWYRYCAAKYRSFDARSGTFQPYHGPRQLCR